MHFGVSAYSGHYVAHIRDKKVCKSFCKSSSTAARTAKTSRFQTVSEVIMYKVCEWSAKPPVDFLHACFTCLLVL